MISLDCTVSQDLASVNLDHLKPRELFYLRIRSLEAIDAELLVFIKAATKRTSYIILSIPIEELTEQTLPNKFLQLGVKGFALRMEHQVEKWLKQLGHGQLHAGDRDLIQKFTEIRKTYPNTCELIPEFQVGTDLRVLGATIAGIHQAGAGWAVLNEESTPAPIRCKEYRDLFEYLKIRGCTKLNIYFPFWKGNSREWDIKTQNTFAGLEHVHIDISNRCTHNCIFCGLYGPSSVDDIKKKSGGVISEAVSNYMKMEINSEKCFNIIESLPWTVKMIQFGGAGDPLMHKDAVNFMAKARERGFAVEVLSNMEYLDDKDIYELHALGGKDMSYFHFIANISAGDHELYTKTRPRQGEKVFNKICHNLSLFSQLRQQNTHGVHFTIMCVVNSLNCTSLLGISKLAARLGASRVWFKPMEIHGKTHEQFIPKKELLQQMAKSLLEAIKHAEDSGIEIMEKEVCHSIIRDHLGDIVHV